MPVVFIVINNMLIAIINTILFSDTLHKARVQKYLSLCEICPNTEFFLVRIFPHSD